MLRNTSVRICATNRRIYFFLHPSCACVFVLCAVTCLTYLFVAPTATVSKKSVPGHDWQGNWDTQPQVAELRKSTASTFFFLPKPHRSLRENLKPGSSDWSGVQPNPLPGAAHLCCNLSSLVAVRVALAAKKRVQADGRSVVHNGEISS
jgi:hypothetical protein